MESKLEQSPIVKAFTLAIIKTILSQNFRYKNNEVVNADLVPRISERISKPRMLGLRRLAEPISLPQKRIVLPQRRIFTSSALSQNYGKLDGLLRDSSVTYIECSGAGKNLMIMRAGQRQGTKISLSQQEIKQLLEKISQATRIPLIEGVFRAAIDNFVINAVVSGVIGDRFIIKKRTPYSLLG